MIKSDPNNLLPDSFKAIDFNIDGLKYSKGLFATNDYGFKGVLKEGDFEIEFNANYKIRPNNFVTQVSEIGSGVTVFGEVLVNAFQFTGSGQLIRMNTPSNSQNQLLKIIYQNKV